MPTAVLFVYHQFGAELLHACRRNGITVARIFTHADGANEHVWWESAAEIGRRHGIPVELDADLKDPLVRARIAADQPDFCFSGYFRQMIGTGILAMAKRGAYNLHGSLLPKYRGRAPVNWQLVNGETESGLTLHVMVASADAGDLVAQERVAVHPDQDAIGLTRQLLAITPDFLDRCLPGLVAGMIRPMPQDHAQATVFGGRKPDDGRLDFTWTARRCHDLVRAVAPPWPGAFAFHGATKLLIWRTAVMPDENLTGYPGTILGDGTLACGRGRLALLHLADAVTGRPVALRPGDRLMPHPA